MTEQVRHPKEEYTRRLEARRAEAAALARRDRQLADRRLGVFLGAVAMGFAAFGYHLFPGWLLAVPLLYFFRVTMQHDAVQARHRELQRAIRFYEAGLARLDGAWSGAGNAGERFRDEQHPYAADLDLFGRGSLFELLCTARTRTGEETLARWLCEAAPVETIRARQAAVEDLRGRIDLRELMAIRGEEVRTAVDAESLAVWGAAPAGLTSGGVLLTARLLGIGVVLALLAWASGSGPLPAAVLAVLGQLFALPFGGGVKDVLQGVDRHARELSVFGGLLRPLEAESFQAPHLQALQRRLQAGGSPPSRHLQRFRHLLSLLEAQRNGVAALLAVVVLWPLQMAILLERWRVECGPQIGEWVAAVAEFEALSALASHAYEHPEDPFPELVEAGPLLEAEGIAHPLLPEEQAVRNDVRLGEGLRLLIVSGSNMSGKSTLLRSVGTNTLLALAGAPVRARRLRVSPMRIGASIRVQDSLQGGISRFYAEILRLRQIVELSEGELPLLFLLDEILHGTNSHDRRIGAEAVIRTLVRHGAVGLVTTHDLALARIADDPALAAENVHLEDDLEDGKIHFDYRLKPGVVQKSNALQLMRAVGLQVGDG